ncbi:MAG: TolC family protein [Waddliaceae bacterium]
MFPSFTLADAEAVALTNNKDILAMRQLVEKVKQGRLESISKWLPEVNLISRGYKTERVQEDTGTRSSFISQLSLTQALFSPDRYYQVKISNFEVMQLNALFDALIIDVLYDIRTAYYAILLDYENIAVAKRTVDLFSSLAKRMEANYDIGYSILLNVNQSKVAIANATSVYYQSAKQLEVDLDRLATLLGYNSGSIKLQFAEHGIPIFSIPDIAEKVVRVEEIFAKQKKEGEIYQPSFPEREERLMKNLYSQYEIEDWEKKALLYRPDLQARCAEWKIAAEQVKKQKGEYLPSVRLEANYGGYPTRMLDNPSSGFFNQHFNWAVGFCLHWLVYDGCGRTYRINQAKHERQAKCLEYSKGIQSLYEEIRKQIFTIEESVANYVTAEGNVKLAEQTLTLADKQLDIGYITVFDYQIVVNALIQAINIRNRARFDLIRGYYGLRHASGVDLMACPNKFKNCH